jgi:branched-chain amino acid transport system substrate-binding protein
MTTRRQFTKIAAGATLALALPAVVRAQTPPQGKPIRIGASISLTGPLAATKNGQIGFELWRDDVNASGGLLGRPVELVLYDDQSSASNVPAIYSKLVDVDHCDVLMSPYGANLSAPVMPFIKQRDLLMIGMFGLAGNDKAQHGKFFHSGPWGPNAGMDWARGFFDQAKSVGVKRVAVINADLEFAKNAAMGAVKVAQEYGMQLVFNQSYLPNTNDFSAMLRNINAANPDAIFVASYPPDSSALIRGIREIGISDNVKMVGGAMVGPQYGSLLSSLGPELNGIVNAHTFVPESTMQTKAMNNFLARYAVKAKEQGVDPLGFYIPPFYYVAGQMVAAAIKGSQSLDQAKMAAYLHSHTIDTIVGQVAFNKIGDWTQRRVLMVQIRNVKGNDLEQFRNPGRQVIVDPPSLKTGKLVVPYNAARAL